MVLSVLYGVENVKPLSLTASTRGTVYTLK